MVIAVANTVWLVLVVAGDIVLSAHALPGPIDAIVTALSSGVLAEGQHTALGVLLT